MYRNYASLVLDPLSRGVWLAARRPADFYAKYLAVLIRIELVASYVGGTMIS